MELRPGPYDRPNGESRRGAERGPPEREESCPFCRWPVEKWWPLIYAPVVELGAETWRSCHLKCLLDALRRDEEHPRAAGVETSFGESVLELVTRAEKALFSRKPSARLGLEDERMCLAAQSTLPPTWPYEELRPIPKATFFLQGVLELRLSCSPQLVEIPPNLGRSTDLESLCLISNSLTSLPSEVGMLRELRFLYLNGNFLRRIPQAVSDLPKLQEICFDANCLEELPHFTAQLRLFTAPGNHLTEVAFWPQLERLEVHGNRLQRLLPLSWHSTSQLVTLKVMGNQLTELPEEVGHMPVLRILGVASNRLRSLPHALAESRELEWLLAYENQLEELPPFGPRNWRLTRLLLESNPLRPVAVQSLVSDLSRSYIKTLGLDSNQVAVPELPDPLPAAVSVGTVIPISGQSQLSLKLTKASRLRRSTDRAESDHPELLIVAFAASQGEPEWLGFLRRLYEVGEVKPCCHRSSLDFAEEADFDARMARLWTHCTQEASTEAPPEETPALPLGDFDVLTVVDHRMRWYAEDRGALQQVLKTLRPKYQKMMCVGASMGGFGALLHGGLVADAVVAFNPQATLTEALLRPPAETPQELEDLSNAVMESVRVALAWKAQMIVHCAADEHLMHALALPKGVALVVHPLQPRKPFARVLDRAQLLIPIVSDALYRLYGVGSYSQESPLLGCWCRSGCLRCVPIEPGRLLRLFFGASGMIPRPGDWFCGGCKARSCRDRYYCWRCQKPITEQGTLKVLDNSNYPSRWDWGCTHCGAAMCGNQSNCSNCGRERPPGKES